MTTYNTILYEQDGPIITITWNRPQVLNAINEELENEFYDACQRADADASCRVVVVKGAGRGFSGGYDIGGAGSVRKWPGGLPEGMDVGTSLDRQRSARRRFWRGQLVFSEMDKPVIGQVHGWCIGGGTWYVLSMDIVVAAEDATFGQPEVRNADGGSFVWATRVGWSNALRLMLTGDHIDAREALRIGAVDEIAPPEKLDEHVRKLAERIALLPAESIKLNKAIIRRGMDMMGYRNGQMLAMELSTLVESSWTRVHQRWDEIAKEGGLRAYLQDRDGPFLPEPFGPRSRMKSWDDR